MDSMIIRSGKIEDIAQISYLWLQMINETKLGNNPNVEWWKTMCSNLINMKDLYFLVIAEIKDKIIGFIDGIIYSEPSTGKIHGIAQNFYVLPEYRQTNTSSKLYRYILKIGKQKGVQIVEFFCSNPEYWAKKGYKDAKVMLRRELICPG
jgi:ribosomal protein S18 acetylase RimI-like enzyme